MIDTSTVNYALGKMTEAWTTTLPHMQNVSAEYVSYAVTKTVVSFTASFLGVVIGTILVIYGLRSGKKDFSNCDDFGPWVATLLIGGIVLMLSTVFITINGCDTITALLHPEMYTVQQLIQSVK